MILLARSKLNSIEVLFSKALIGSDISPDKFVLINNVVKEYDNMKEGIENLVYLENNFIILFEVHKKSKK